MSLPSDNPVLDARALRYPADGSVLQQASLAVGEGETVAVLGPAESGKSALLDCLTGRITPSSGSIWANGKAFHLFSAEQKRSFQRRSYGLVPQRTGFVPELTVVQNTALPLIFAGVAREEAVRRARTWLERFEVGEDSGRRAESLPTESLRRAALARGMVTDPLMLFADEPLAGLEGASVAALARMLLSIARSHGTSVVLFTRDEETAGRFQRRVDLAYGRTPNQPVPTAPATAARAPKPAPTMPAVTTKPRVSVVAVEVGKAEVPQAVGQAVSQTGGQPRSHAVGQTGDQPGSQAPLSQPPTMFSPPREPRPRGGLPLGAPNYLNTTHAEANR